MTMKNKDVTVTTSDDGAPKRCFRLFRSQILSSMCR